MWISDILFMKVSVPLLYRIYTQSDTEILLALHCHTRITIQHEYMTVVSLLNDIFIS